MNIVEKKLIEVIPYEKNPRKNDNAVPAVAASIKEFGFRVPIVLDKDNVIVAGHTRYKAAQLLNLETVPCMIVDDLTPEQIKAFRLADNKVAEQAEWDFDLLDEELNDILDIDMTDFGFDLSEQDNMEPIADDEDMQDSTLSYEHMMKIDNKKVVLTDEEFTMIMDKLDAYIDENGVSFGFVRSLCE